MRINQLISNYANSVFDWENHHCFWNILHIGLTYVALLRFQQNIRRNNNNSDIGLTSKVNTKSRHACLLTNVIAFNSKNHMVINSGKPIGIGKILSQ